MITEFYSVAVPLIQFIRFAFIFVYVFYLKVYFSYNLDYHMISVSSYVVITASAQPYKSTSLLLTL